MKILPDNIKQQMSEKAALGIANIIIKAQTCFVKIMQLLTRKWKQPQRCVFLYFICLIFGGFSMVVLILPFRSNQTSKIILQTTVTPHIQMYPRIKGFLITKEEFQKVQQFKSGHPNLKIEMPELYERLNSIEQSYFSQQK